VNPDPSRLVCGIAVSWATARPAQFREFLAAFAAGQAAVALRIEHQPQFRYTGGVETGNIGHVVALEPVEAWDGFPGGLCALGQLGEAWADTIIRDAKALDQWQAMSTGGMRDVHTDALTISEVSLVSRRGRQKDEFALVAGYGQDAVSAWEVLTGQPVPGA
jgi:hypothetical protein